MRLHWSAGLVLVTALAVTPALADPVPVLDATCPEGCRTADMVVSCSAEANVVYCDMHTDGNVTMLCNTGYQYSTTSNGCSTSINATMRALYLSRNFDTRTIFNFMIIFAKVYASPSAIVNDPPYIVISCVEIAATLYLWLIGVRCIRLTRVLVGALIGELLSIVILASFNVTLDTVWKHAPLWFAPIVVGLVAGVWRRALRFLCGFGSGFILGAVLIYEAYAREGKNDIDSTVFYVMIAMVGFFTVLGNPFQYEAFNLFVALFGALCATSALLQLAGDQLRAGCQVPSSSISSCPKWIPEGIFGGCLIVGCIALWIGHRSRVRKLREEESLGGYVNMNRPLNNTTTNNASRNYGSASL